MESMRSSELAQAGLLPCPFCGGEPTVSSFPGAHNVWCSNQPVTCGNRSMYTSEQWNRRAQPAPAQDEREARDWEMKAQGIESVIHYVVSKRDQDLLRQHAADKRAEAKRISGLGGDA